MAAPVGNIRGAVGLSRGRAGFTFIELMVVMSLIAVLTAAVVPLYGAAMNSLRTRNVKNALVGVIQYTQQQAVVESREYRVCFHEEQKVFWVVQWVETVGDEKKFEAVAEDWGRERELPHDLEFKKLPKQKDRKLKASYLAFYPNGSSDQAEIQVADTGPGRRGFSIEVLGALGKVNVKDSGSAGHSRVYST
jgi:prepilin-type N-terminal cleavage/methylation domain-containing protein